MTRHGPPCRPGRPDGGFALLLVLWTLVLVSLLFVLLAAAARSDARLAANLRGAAELEALADGAIHAAIFGLLQAEGAAPDGGTARQYGAGVAVEVASETGLVNPNVVSPQLLRALLVRVGAEPGQAARLAGAISDWRSPGRRPGPNGAKAAQYRAAGLGYGPPGTPFESLGELGDVLGMTPALAAAVMPHLTLAWDGEPDRDAAGPVVRAALQDVGVHRGVSRGAGRAGVRVVRITATASRGDGTAAGRRAVVRIGPSPNQRAWRVHSWASWTP